MSAEILMAIALWCGQVDSWVNPTNDSVEEKINSKASSEWQLQYCRLSLLKCAAEKPFDGCIIEHTKEREARASNIMYETTKRVLAKYKEDEKAKKK